MYRFLGPGMNFLCWDSPFLFSEFSSSWDRYSAEDSEFCFVSLWPDGILILFFDIFGNGGQGNFEKGISCFDKSPFGFSFLFYEQLNKERYTSVWFNSFSGRVLWIFRIVSVRIVAALLIMLIGSAFSEDIRSRTWSCRIVSWLEWEELIESQSALWYNLTLMGDKIYLLKFVKKSKRIAVWSEVRSLFKVRFWILLKIAGEKII